MKVLILRFSSFGDILQCLSAAGAIKRDFPKAEIHWATRKDFKELIEEHPSVEKVWSLSRKGGFQQLCSLAKKLKKENFTHVYDAHNNLRSHFVLWSLLGPFKWKVWIRGTKWIRRPSERIKRFFLFSFRINLYEQPWNGQRNFLKPLKKWKVQTKSPPPPQLFFAQKTETKIQNLFSQEVWPLLQKKSKLSTIPPLLISLAPSASYPLKRWPLFYWKRLIELLPDFFFLILGGPQDLFLQSFLEPKAKERQEFKKKFERKKEDNFQMEKMSKLKGSTLNFTSGLSFMDSAALIKLSSLLITNDTGLMHAAEQLGTPCFALMGPTAFGFPSRPLTKVLEVKLKCKPCSPHGQGPCHNPYFQQCLRELSPEKVAKEIRHFFKND